MVQLYSTGTFIQYLAITYTEKESGKEYIRVYYTFPSGPNIQAHKSNFPCSFQAVQRHTWDKLHTHTRVYYFPDSFPLCIYMTHLAAYLKYCKSTGVQLKKKSSQEVEEQDRVQKQERWSKLIFYQFSPVFFSSYPIQKVITERKTFSFIEVISNFELLNQITLLRIRGLYHHVHVTYCKKRAKLVKYQRKLCLNSLNFLREHFAWGKKGK